MIDHLDNLLVQLLSTQAGLTAGQIGFQPPDRDWRNLGLTHIWSGPLVVS